MQSNAILFCILTLVCIQSKTSAELTEAGEYYYPHCNTTSNYTAGSVYASNLRLVLNSLVSNVSKNNGYYNTTSGTQPNIVYGQLQCRGDATKEACASCANTSATTILKDCPSEKAAEIHYDYCWLYYADYPFFSTKSTFPITRLPSPHNASDPNYFSKEVTPLMKNLMSTAASELTKFADESVVSVVFGIVQCTPYMSNSSCLTCLQANLDTASKWFHSNDGDTDGGRAISPSCYMRYESTSFFATDAPPPKTVVAGTAPPISNGPRKGTTKRNIIIAVVLVVSVLICAICIFLFRRRRNEITAKFISKDGAEEDLINNVESLLFNLSSIQSATNNFSDSNKLGEGGFGSVYKGTLPDGREIAVKRLSLKSAQGLEELKTEVVFVAKLMHRNLVRLLGFCLQNEEKLLVYEYLSNGSLDQILFDQRKCLLLGWDKRYNIIIGIARGLLYLHQDSQLRIIHRDLKASNILLDENMNAKISDFGLARLFVESQVEANTKRIAGTLGYMAPEYVMNGCLSTKSDIFSFGVLVLEIVAGRVNSSFRDAENLISYTWHHWSNGTAIEMVDATLGLQCLPMEVRKCIQLGLLCVEEDPHDRPTMSQVVLLLNSHSSTCPLPSRPAFATRVRIASDVSNGKFLVSGSDQSTTRGSQQSINEVTITDTHPR